MADSIASQLKGQLSLTSADSSSMQASKPATELRVGAREFVPTWVPQVQQQQPAAPAYDNADTDNTAADETHYHHWEDSQHTWGDGDGQQQQWHGLGDQDDAWGWDGGDGGSWHPEGDNFDGQGYAHWQPEPAAWDGDGDDQGAWEGGTEEGAGQEWAYEGQQPGGSMGIGLVDSGLPEADEVDWWEAGEAAPPPPSQLQASPATASAHHQGAGTTTTTAPPGGRQWKGGADLAQAARSMSYQDQVELLGMLCPGYSSSALAALLKAQGGDLMASVREISMVEKEAGGRVAAAWQAGTPQPMPMLSKMKGAAKTERTTVEGAPEAATRAVSQPHKAPSCPKTERTTQLVLDDSEAFPTLGGSTTPAQAPQKGAGGGAPAPWAAAVAPKAPAATPTPARAPTQPLLVPRIGRVAGVGGAGRRAGNVSEPSRCRHQGARNAGDRAGGGEVTWVETGVAVAAAYAREREEARHYMRVRNACYQQATLAFLSGDKALARKLSQQGRQAAEHMAAAHATAARRTVAARNPHLRTDGDSGSSGWCGEDTGVRGGGGPPLLDLHGLHVAEALSTLEDQLVELSSDRGMAGGKRLRVCVGMGRHSKTVARLPGAVKAALQEWGVGYREDVPGLLDLDLTGL